MNCIDQIIYNNINDINNKTDNFINVASVILQILGQKDK